MTKMDRFTDLCLNWLFVGVWPSTPLWFGIYHTILSREAEQRKDLWPMVGHTVFSLLCLSVFCMFFQSMCREGKSGKQSE